MDWVEGKLVFNRCLEECGYVPRIWDMEQEEPSEQEVKDVLENLEDVRAEPDDRVFFFDWDRGEKERSLMGSTSALSRCLFSVRSLKGMSR